MSSLPIFSPGQDAPLDGPGSTYRWATVTDAAPNPLRVRLDGDSDGLPITPDTLIPPSTLAVGDRVWVQLFGRRLIILGKGGGSSGLASQILGSATLTAATAGTTSSTAVDVSGLSVTWTALEGHAYRTSLVGRGRSTVNGDVMTVRINDGNNNQVGGFHYLPLPLAANAYSFSTEILSTPDAGPVTHKACIERASGSGSVQLHALGASSPIRLYVQDLGLVTI